MGPIRKVCGLVWRRPASQRPHARWSRVSAAAVTQPQHPGSAPAPRGRSETFFVGEKESTAPFHRLSLPPPHGPPPVPKHKPLAPPARPPPSCVTQEEPLSLSELCGQMGTPGDRRAHAGPPQGAGFADVTVAAPLLQSGVTTAYLWLHQLCGFVDPKSERVLKYLQRDHVE